MSRGAKNRKFTAAVKEWPTRESQAERRQAQLDRRASRRQINAHGPALPTHQLFILIMTRALQTLSILLLASSVYLAVALGHIPLPLPPKFKEDVVPLLPVWSIVSLGAYLLFKLGWGVLTFNDVPEAYNGLMKEVEMARKDLRAKGVLVD
ncbi:MAG: hypothetical protein M1816_000612 [Peltula sp. TS41687]|nr:MAG: hypothetical protein M1816_000612 [Peltula sp. TS41687]